MVDFMKLVQQNHFTVRDDNKVIEDIKDAYLFTVEEIHRANHTEESYDWENCNKVLCVLCKEMMDKYR